MRAVAELYMSRWLNKFTAKLEMLSKQPIPIVNNEGEECAKEAIEKVFEKIAAKVTVNDIIEDILKNLDMQTEVKSAQEHSSMKTKTQFKCEMCQNVYVRKKCTTQA